jgi:excisionase family DNA binding protein
MPTRSAHQAVATDLDCSLLTPSEVGDLLRTSRKAIYAMIERRQLPGVVRIGRRVLIDQSSLLDWLGQKSTASSEMVGR